MPLSFALDVAQGRRDMAASGHGDTESLAEGAKSSQASDARICRSLVPLMSPWPGTRSKEGEEEVKEARACVADTEAKVWHLRSAPATHRRGSLNEPADTCLRPPHQR